jgi:hypothetical protein
VSRNSAWRSFRFRPLVRVVPNGCFVVRSNIEEQMQSNVAAMNYCGCQQPATSGRQFSARLIRSERRFDEIFFENRTASARQFPKREKLVCLRIRQRGRCPIYSTSARFDSNALLSS